MVRKKRILMVDDDIPFSLSTQILLEDTGDYEVRVENESSAAVSAAKEFQPDVILLDIVMPGFDGGDVRALLRDEPELANIPVMIISALVTNKDTGDGAFVECLEQIMFTKPISGKKLVDEIEKRLVLNSEAN